MAKRLTVGLILSLGLGVTTPIAYGQQQVQPAADVSELALKCYHKIHSPLQEY